jgi:hypothetical protein
MTNRNKYTRIMLDLETIGTKHDAAIVAIGAVAFSSAEGIYSHFYTTVSLESSLFYRGTVDASTILFWMGMESQARKEIIEASTSLPLAMSLFSKWLLDLNTDISRHLVWGNGSDFDNVIFNNAYRNTGNPGMLWPYRNNRCYRTLKNLNPQIPCHKPKIPHHALWDATAQAEHALEIVKHLGIEI